MSPEHFCDLWQSYCQVSGHTHRRLEPDAHGVWVFQVVEQDYALSVVYSPALTTSDAFIFFNLGQVPHTVPEVTWRSLLQANLSWYGKNSPTFGMTASNDLVLQTVYPLEHASGRELNARVMQLVKWAHEWRSGQGIGARETQAGDGMGRMDFSRFA